MVPLPVSAWCPALLNADEWITRCFCMEDVSVCGCASLCVPPFTGGRVKYSGVCVSSPVSCWLYHRSEVCEAGVGPLQYLLKQTHQKQVI